MYLLTRYVIIEIPNIKIKTPVPERKLLMKINGKINKENPINICVKDFEFSIEYIVKLEKIIPSKTPAEILTTFDSIIFIILSLFQIFSIQILLGI